jgi:hypothetical protein
MEHAVLSNTQVKLKLAALHTAMFVTVAEIGEHADHQPYDQTEPGNAGQIVHPPSGKHQRPKGRVCGV